MMDRRIFLTTVAGLLAVPLGAEGQPSGKVYRIGFLGLASAAGYASQLEALRRGFRDLGYVEGKNLLIEYRWADDTYDRLPVLAADLVRLKVDVIVTHGTPGTRAAKEATTTIPIVMAISGDAVATGLIPSIARPGGSITGSTYFFPELQAKRLELLKEALPRVTRVAALVNPGNPVNGPALKAMEVVAGLLRVDLQHVEVRGPGEFDRVLSTMGKKRVEALVILDDGMLIANAPQLARVTTDNRLPAIGFKEYAQAGGLFAYTVDFPEIWRRAPVFVDKILKGAKPGDLPVEQAIKFEFVINRRTAKALGLTIPPSLLGRADQVIE